MQKPVTVTEPHGLTDRLEVVMHALIVTVRGKTVVRPLGESKAVTVARALLARSQGKA